MAISLVKAGSAVTGTTSLSPLFGQATTANNFLVCWVAAVGANPGQISLSAGWPQAVNVRDSAMVWYKANCGGGEPAPTVTLPAATFSAAVLAEFSGAATSLPVDQTNTNISGTSPNTAT